MNFQKKKMAAGFLIHDSDRYVQAVSFKNPRAIGIPGGKVDPGENVIQAAVREVREESGIDLEAIPDLYNRVTAPFVRLTSSGDFVMFAFALQADLSLLEEGVFNECTMTVSPIWNLLYGDYAEYNGQMMLHFGLPMLEPAATEMSLGRYAKHAAAYRRAEFEQKAVLASAMHLAADKIVSQLLSVRGQLLSCGGMNVEQLRAKEENLRRHLRLMGYTFNNQIGEAVPIPSPVLIHPDTLRNT